SPLCSRPRSRLPHQQDAPPPSVLPSPPSSPSCPFLASVSRMNSSVSPYRQDPAARNEKHKGNPSSHCSEMTLGEPNPDRLAEHAQARGGGAAGMISRLIRVALEPQDVSSPLPSPPTCHDSFSPLPSSPPSSARKTTAAHPARTSGERSTIHL